MNHLVFASSSWPAAAPAGTPSPWYLVSCRASLMLAAADGTRLSAACGDVLAFPVGLYAPVKGEHFQGIVLILADATLPRGEVPFRIRDNEKGLVHQAFAAALYYYRGAEEEETIILDAYAGVILAYLLSWHTKRLLSPLVTQIEEDIRKNYASTAYKLDDYLHSFGYSYDYLRKLFKKELGLTPHKYLMELRLEAAARRLLSTDRPDANIAEVSVLCGFPDPLYFSRLFKKKYGVSPRRFQLEGRRDPRV